MSAASEMVESGVKPARPPRRKWLRRKFALYMADVNRLGSHVEWAEENRIPLRTVQRWMRHPETQAVLVASKDTFKARLLPIAIAVARKAERSGDPNAFKVLAEWVGDYKTVSESTIKNDPYLQALEKLAKDK